MRKIFFKFLKISILWPLTFYSDPALAYCGPGLFHWSHENGVESYKSICYNPGYKMIHDNFKVDEVIFTREKITTQLSSKGDNIQEKGFEKATIEI